ncbi:seipin-1 isoform X2 [Vigna angularis]|uniref:seipin-1 isoform X2 n=1 Tax=Phaseolus angularis TaxID=3914 RepID=UPI0022B55778|nr:seipin-1 isoform X2 [Vigna angularis]
MHLHAFILISPYETPLHHLPMEEHQEEGFLLPTPLPKLLSFQTDLVYNGLVSLFSPLFALFAVASQSYHRAEETTHSVESAVQRAPSQITHGGTLLLKKLGLCFLSVAYVCMILIFFLFLATVVGVGLVRFWVEEPVSVKEKLHFDYTQPHPTALFSFNGFTSFKGHLRKKQISVPVGHTFFASLVLVMPESDFNRELGVFQLTTELVSVNEHVVAKSSQPCMLRFRSSPIRLARTFLMGVPLVMGISGETQNINVEILRHREDYRRSNAIRVTLHPRAGTSNLPELYEAEILMRSNLPWTKEPVLFLVTPQHCSNEVGNGEAGDGNEVCELLREWRRSRGGKRKSRVTDGGVAESVVGSSASGISMSTREDATSVSVEDDVEDSESVCLG